MKRLVVFCLLFLLGLPADAQQPGISYGGSGGITINATPVTGGSNNNCLTISSGTVGNAACGISGLTVTGTPATLALTANQTYTFPTASSTLAILGANTFAGTQTFSDASTWSTTGIAAGITGSATTPFLGNGNSGIYFSALNGNVSITSGGTNVVTFTTAGNIVVNGGGIQSLGNLSMTGALTITNVGASALAVGRQGATTPAFAVNAATASQTGGLLVTGSALNGTVAVAVTDTSGNTNITIDAKSAGTMGIGTISTGQISLGASATVVSIVSTAPLLPNITTGTNADFLCRSAGGAILLQTSACTISSARFKRDIAPLDGDALAIIDQLHPVAFNMREEMRSADPNFDRRQIGLTAENVAAVDPRLAIYEDDLETPKSYRQESVIAVLVGAVKELKAANDEAAACRRDFFCRLFN